MQSLLCFYPQTNFQDFQEWKLLFGGSWASSASSGDEPGLQLGDALAEFEELFGEKAGEYIAEYELAIEEALVVSARAGEQKGSICWLETLENDVVHFQFCFSKRVRIECAWIGIWRGILEELQGIHDL